ncbi:MAG: hypothetical protein IJ693_07175, partial [Bacteroidaceae bacterium]|nr:hypothetical protein [Bacteroidaceae bacterium]
DDCLFFTCSQSVKELFSSPPLRKASAKVRPFHETAKLLTTFFQKILNFYGFKGISPTYTHFFLVRKEKKRTFALN